MSAPLTWGGWAGENAAMSGDVVVGQIIEHTDGSGWTWTIDAVQMRWIAKGRGKVSSKAQAKRSLSRAWNIWKARAGL